MRIVSKRALREFWEKHPDAKQPLADWYHIARRAGWNHLPDTRRDFPHADPCGTCTIFNIKDDLPSVIDLCDVRFVLKHADYDREGWKNDCGC